METPREIDTALAAVYTDIYKASDRLAVLEIDAKRMAGADYYYSGRQRVTDMTLEEADAILAPQVKDYEEDRFGYGRLETSGSSSVGQLRDNLEHRASYEALIADLLEQRDALENEYTGWSRFFLVTSSAGHVHSSMNCTTCRHTTRYGWMPDLSGKDEAAAVDELGGTLCTVCFPSAPTEWTEGKKITAAQAAKKVAA